MQYCKYSLFPPLPTHSIHLVHTSSNSILDSYLAAPPVPENLSHWTWGSEVLPSDPVRELVSATPAEPSPTGPRSAQPPLAPRTPCSGARSLRRQIRYNINLSVSHLHSTIWYCELWYFEFLGSLLDLWFYTCEMQSRSWIHQKQVQEYSNSW